jgi:hypothetical protein
MFTKKLRFCIAVLIINLFFVSVLGSEGNDVEEFCNFLRTKTKIVNSGHISIEEYRYKWKNLDDYQKFAEELKKHTTTPVDKFKKWLIEDGSVYLAKAEKISYSQQEYYFQGENDRFIRIVSTPKEQLVFIEQARLKDIPFRLTGKIEYASDGKSIQEYTELKIGRNGQYEEKGELSIRPISDLTKHGYFKPFFVDYSLFSVLQDTLCNDKNLILTKKDSKYIFEHNNLKVQAIFDLTLAGGLITHREEKVVTYKGETFNLLTEFISGSYSKVNDIVYLPHFCSTGKPPTTDYLLYIVKWDLRPVKSEELKIPLPLPTTVRDYTVGETPRVFEIK